MSKEKKLIIPGLSNPTRPGKFVLLDGTELVLGQEARPQEASPETQAGVVGITELAEKYGLSEKYIRARLRKLGLKKAGPKWAWPPGHPELVQIESLFKK